MGSRRIAPRGACAGFIVFIFVYLHWLQLIGGTEVMRIFGGRFLGLPALWSIDGERGAFGGYLGKHYDFGAGSFRIGENCCSLAGPLRYLALCLGTFSMVCCFVGMVFLSVPLKSMA